MEQTNGFSLWEELAAEALGGDREALSRLLWESAPRVYQIILSLVRDSAESMESAQTAIQEIQQNIRVLEDPAGYPKWMRRMAYQEAVERLYLQTPELFSEQGAPAEGETTVNESGLFERWGEMPREISQSEDDDESLLTLMGELTAEQQLLLQLFYYEKYSFPAVALMTRCPQAAALPYFAQAQDVLEAFAARWEEARGLGAGAVAPDALFCHLLDRLFEAPIPDELREEALAGVELPVGAAGEESAEESVEEAGEASEESAEEPGETLEEAGEEPDGEHDAGSETVESEEPAEYAEGTAQPSDAEGSGKKKGLVIGIVAVVAVAALAFLYGGGYFGGQEKPRESSSTAESSEEAKAPTKQEAEKPAAEKKKPAVDPYKLQELGMNPVYFYQHPTLDIAVDFRSNPYAARRFYVVPTEDGFWACDRELLSVYEGNAERLTFTPEGQPKEVLSQLGGIYYRVGTEGDAKKKAEEMDAKKFTGGYLQIDDSRWIIEEMSSTAPSPLETVCSYFEEDIWGASFESALRNLRGIKSYIIASPSAPEEIEVKGDPDHELDLLRERAEESPLWVEWRYGLPRYAWSDNYDVSGENPKTYPVDILKKLPSSTVYANGGAAPVYVLFEKDLDGDKTPEIVYDCAADAAPFFGYTAVFSKRPDGLVLKELKNKTEAGQVFYKP